MVKKILYLLLVCMPLGFFVSAQAEFGFSIGRSRPYVKERHSDETSTLSGFSIAACTDFNFGVAQHVDIAAHLRTGFYGLNATERVYSPSGEYKPEHLVYSAVIHQDVLFGAYYTGRVNKTTSIRAGAAAGFAAEIYEPMLRVNGCFEAYTGVIFDEQFCLGFKSYTTSRTYDIGYNSYKAVILAIDFKIRLSKGD